MQTSYANAGQLSYGYTTPWAAPGIPKKAIKWMLKPHSPLIIRPDGSLFQLQWILQMWRNCNVQNYAINKSRMVRISEYSREMLRIFEQENPDFSFEGRHKGTLQIFRTEKEVAAAKADIQILQDYGVPLTIIDNPKDCANYEPALANVAHKLAGALHLPQDGTGDCRLFAQKLKEKCLQLGVNFLFKHHIDRIVVKNGKIAHTIVNGASLCADHYVCALGYLSRDMFKSVGIKLPIYPVKGYSLTLPILNENAAPVSTVLDETYKVAITRFDTRIRVGGMAELSGYQHKLVPKHKTTLSFVVNDLFEGSCDTQQAEFWTGLRPMTPDSTPIIGKSPLANLTFNTGHGTLGWTMALGSGKITADIVSGVTPEIDVKDLSFSRYQKP